jgi:hypothetical protein
VIFGADDDNVDNPVIQPEGAVDQSLNNADAIDGKNGDDVLIGLLGSDTIRGGKGNDVIIGGTEQGSQPNSDIMYGDEGNDVNLWRGGDGSDAFVGGRDIDALVFGNIDRDASNIPIVSPATGRHEKTGLPSADVTGQGGFCTLDDVRGQGSGYEFLVRFFARATGNLLVTVRTAEVEQVFCTSQAGGAITFADLTAPPARNSSRSLSARSRSSTRSSARSSADPQWHDRLQHLKHVHGQNDRVTRELRLGGRGLRHGKQPVRVGGRLVPRSTACGSWSDSVSPTRDLRCRRGSRHRRARGAAARRWPSHGAVCRPALGRGHFPADQGGRRARR